MVIVLMPSQSEKMAAAALVKKRLDELPSKINEIRNYEAGIDIRRLNWSYDIVLTMDFDTLADLETYIIHPDHKKFIEFNNIHNAKSSFSTKGASICYLSFTVSQSFKN